MPKVSFRLKRPGSKTPTAIILMYSCADGRLQYYTGQAVAQKNWMVKEQVSTSKGVNQALNRLVKQVNEYSDNQELADKAVTTTGLKHYLEKQKRLPGKGDVNKITDVFTALIDKMEKGEVLTPSKKKYAPGSIKAMRFTVDLLSRFKPALTVSAVTMETYHKFINYCHEKEYSTNYTGAQIKNWKSLGKMAGGNDIYESPAFKKMTEQTYDIYLDESELKAMMNLDLPPRQGLVRDWFILDCYTGLRVSDLTLLADKNLKDGKITIANKKTDETVVIPAHPFVKEIVKRYKGFPPPVTDVEINRVIKGVAEQADIKEDILFTITKGGKRKDTHLKKWQMVSCHSGRRSFITNLRKNGVPDSVVMKLTGIRAISTVTRYDKLTAPEAARIAAGMEFFK